MNEELANTRQRIGRLMSMVEHGLAEASDPGLSTKLSAARKDRDIAAAGIERVCRRIGPALDLDPGRIVAFSNFMKDRIRNGDIPFRKAYIRSIIDHIVVSDRHATLSGRRDGLRALVAIHNEGGQAVPTGIQEWCATPERDIPLLVAVVLEPKRARLGWDRTQPVRYRGEVSSKRPFR
ncbi:hypothetical protein [Aurantimonas sp. A3-2-R12]|uniref:hypothetical protein n=1 Tax=Aurantimonas sp. A3-2-R12 TaxID=3114362 RepID=UPI002E199102|nr:hypothetical protein [Aurantimonas sp. A3-2-R12]